MKRVEELRGSSVICYLTSLRPNVAGVIAGDQVRVFFDHLLRLPARPIKKLDIFLVSNGGDSVVPWRLIALFREFAEHIAVLIPYRAYSAATLLALGADEIVMHPFAELGPIDPTVSNEFNPTNQMGQRLGISVEDVKAYVNFIKSTVGIHHEDELIQAVQALTEKVHPLALGNVERFVSQSRMVARKLLGTHMAPKDLHAIDEIVENMASKLYFHGHPINRKEAKDDLKLKIAENVQPEVETAIWDLYLSYEREFENAEVFDPSSLLWGLPPAPQGQQAVTTEAEFLHAMIESSTLRSSHRTKHRYTQLALAPGQIAVRDDLLSQGWNHSPAPKE
jgi:hypothetical protein